MTDVKLSSAPKDSSFKNKNANDKPVPRTKELDLYSYTGRVKFFDQDKGFGYIQEIPDTGNLKNVVKEWRVTAAQLGNTVIHRGDFVYFLKHGKTIGEISPINLRDLLKTPCPKCGRRDYAPGKDSVCRHCGNQLPVTAAVAGGTDTRDSDPAFNCLAGTDEDKACPTCGRHAWKRYGYHQNIRCRCCGSDYPQESSQLNAFGKILFFIISLPLLLIYSLLFKRKDDPEHKILNIVVHIIQSVIFWVVVLLIAAGLVVFVEYYFF